MLRRGLGAIVTCALLLPAGCGHSPDPAGDATTESPASSGTAEPSHGTSTEPSEPLSPSGTEESLDAPSTEPVTDTGPEASRLLRQGLRALFEEQVVDFRHTFTAGSTLLLESTGRVF